MMKDAQHDNLETVQKNSDDDNPNPPTTNGLSNKPSIPPSSNKFNGEDTPNLPRRLPLFASRPTMVLTLDNGEEGNSAGWVWDEDQNRFVQYHIPVEDLPIYKCSYCPKSFRGSGALSDHLRSHRLGGTSVISKFEVTEPKDVAVNPTETKNLTSSLGDSASLTSSDMDTDNNEYSDSPDTDNASESQKVEATTKIKRIRERVRARKRRMFTSETTIKRVQKRRIQQNTKNKRDTEQKGSSLVVNIPGVTEHIEVIRSKGKIKQAMCKLCEKVFSSVSCRQNAARHIKSVHLGEKPFPCPACSLAFSLKQNLEHHMRSHRGYKAFRCQICPAQFYQKGQLTVHLRVHSGIKHYRCDVCGVAFYQRHLLKNHIRGQGHKEMVDAAKAEEKVA